jgi:LPXTG-motif cell wall-anchored protein
MELDPVTGISFGWLLLLVGLIELLLSGILYYYRARLLPCF